MMNNAIDTHKLNWFERHLNWTALGMAIAGVIVFAFFAIVSMGFNIIVFTRYFKLGFTPLLLIMLTFISCFLHLSIGYGWILFKKNRSPVFLVFFLPGIFTCIFYILTNLTTLSGDSPFLTILPILSLSIFPNPITTPPYLEIVVSPVPWLIIWVNEFAFIIGWVVLVFLGNRELLDTKDKVEIKKTSFLARFFNSRKRVKTSLISSTGISLVLAVISFFNINFGYSPFHIKELGTTLPERVPEFSCEYPNSFGVPEFEPTYNFPVINGKSIELERIFFNNIQLWESNSFFVIEIYPQKSTDYLVKTVGLDTDDFTGFPKTFFKPHSNYQEPIISHVMIGNIPARQQYLVDPEENRTSIAVDFVLNGRWWVIWYENDKAFNTPPAYFTHLLETFKIYDE
jgi:hypothetical protein